MNASRIRWLSGCRRSPSGGRGFHRISRSSDIQRIFRRGRFRRTRGLKLGYAANRLGHHRVAFAPTRSLRRAVDRNRQKRISREAYRDIVGDIAGSYDLVFVIYGDASTTTRDRRIDMVTLLGAARLLGRPER